MGLLDQYETIVKQDAELTRLRAQIKIQKAAIDRWVPCPDHRDNRTYDGCPVCRDERRNTREAVLAKGLVIAEERLYRHGLLEGPNDPVVKARATLDVPDTKEQT